MFRFWEIAIAPAVEAVRAHRIVYIGAVDDDTRALLLEALGAGGELHVIDPSAPTHDGPDDESSDRYFLHRGHSHELLPLLPPVDVALIDGDHNWYTVSSELQLLSDTARAAGRPAPLLMLHDVAWPYGRRDLYEQPSRVPEEFRQQYARGGVRPGWSGVQYYDANGNGVLDATDPAIPAAGLQAIPALAGGLSPGQSITIHC